MRRLLETWMRDRTLEARNALVEQMIRGITSMLRKQARTMYGVMGEGDLAGIAACALIDAVERCNTTEPAVFGGYAVQKAKAALREEMRRLFGRGPSDRIGDPRLAGRLEDEALGEHIAHRTYRAWQASRRFSVDTDRLDMQDRLRERLHRESFALVHGRYWHDLMYKEIAPALGVCESRAWQMMDELEPTLCEILRDYKPEGNGDE